MIYFLGFLLFGSSSLHIGESERREAMNNLQLLTTEELENTKGGVALAEIVAISGVANFFVSVFNAGYKFGADLARRH